MSSTASARPRCECMSMRPGISARPGRDRRPRRPRASATLAGLADGLDGVADDDDGLIGEPLALLDVEHARVRVREARGRRLRHAAVARPRRRPRGRTPPASRRAARSRSPSPRARSSSTAMHRCRTSEPSAIDPRVAAGEADTDDRVADQVRGLAAGGDALPRRPCRRAPRPRAAARSFRRSSAPRSRASR